MSCQFLGFKRCLVLLALGASVLVGCSTANNGGGQDGAATAQDSEVAGQLGDSNVLDVADDVPAVDVQAADEVAATDLGPADSGADLSVTDAGCTGAGCSCKENTQCDSGFCVEVDAAKQCAKLCAEGCDAGMHCAQVASAGGDIVNVCVPQYPRICEPCQADSDCNNVLGGSDNRCMPYKDASGAILGAFCGAACDSDSACPADYGCKTGASLGGVSSGQCVKKDLVCACDTRATKLQLLTACSSVNAAGTCGGKRSCGDSGLGACSAGQAQAETCNLLDDDCDGQTDEPGPGLCDDNLPCTYDNCVAGDCQHPPKTGACDDGSVCSSGDECNNGKCQGSAVVCDDKNPCTIDSCDPIKGCTVAPDDLGQCSDGNACTVGDLCAAGKCLPGTATECNDNNLCTTDSCSVKDGCVFAHNTVPCSDGNLCTTADACANGSCVGGAPLPCADGNPCTDDACDGIKGCTFAANSVACSDGNVCTQGDLCQGAKCAPGKSIQCDDGNPCTNDLCDALSGCTTVNNKMACDDGDICTLGDTCQGGDCQAGKPVGCDDGNTCTNDGCDPTQGCQHSANSGICSDNNGCTVFDSCQGGSCMPGPQKTCDDANPCTQDFCDPVKGCQAMANSLPCDDGSLCTDYDICKGGTCTPGSPKACADGNPCTMDACDAVKGCQFILVPGPCNDGNVCTLGDNCQAGFCMPAAVTSCDDANTCTSDSCDPVKGCVHGNVGGNCSDGNACTVGDTCSLGACVGTPTNCDDNNPCTTDSCDSKQGCLHAALADQIGCGVNLWCKTGQCVAKAYCGDGIVNQASEQCDDGNAIDNDVCNNKCQFNIKASATFQSCGATGLTGPTQGQCDATYTGADQLTGKVQVSSGIQLWTVPVTANYSVEAWGAQGGLSGGKGAKIYGEFSFKQGDQLKILVGQMGLDQQASSGVSYFGGGGGGGSFVTRQDNSPLLIAGGGGGWGYGAMTFADGQTGTAGGSTNGAGGGANGAGGAVSGGDGYGSGGGGLTGSGANGYGGSSKGGIAFTSGGSGGKGYNSYAQFPSTGDGGFGAGGGVGCDNVCRAGGGGGYSGGQGGTYSNHTSGGGGGSYNSGANPVATGAFNAGVGKVIIKQL